MKTLTHKSEEVNAPVQDSAHDVTARVVLLTTEALPTPIKLEGLSFDDPPKSIFVDVALKPGDVSDEIKDFFLGLTRKHGLAGQWGELMPDIDQGFWGSFHFFFRVCNQNTVKAIDAFCLDVQTLLNDYRTGGVQ